MGGGETSLKNDELSKAIGRIRDKKLFYI